MALPLNDLEAGRLAPQRSAVSRTRPISQEIGRSLPAAAFRSRSFQAEEDAAIWTRSWVGVGFLDEIPLPGDVLPFTVGHHGIHVERLEDGSLAGRFNKAQHGGCRTVPVQCQTGVRTKCSFTACGHSRDRRPILHDDADRQTSLDQYLGLRPERLIPVSLQTVGPIIFAALDADVAAPPDWADCQGLVAADLAAPAGASATRWVEQAANWKHVAASLAEGRLLSQDAGQAVAMQPLAETRTALIYPNVVIVSTDRLSCIVLLQPTAMDQTLCRLRIYGAAPDLATQEAALFAAIDARGRAAEALSAAVDGAEPGDAGDERAPVRAWFEGRILEAMDALAERPLEGPLFNTRDKGSWR